MESTQKMKQKLSAAFENDTEHFLAYLEEYRADERKAVQTMIASFQKKYDNWQAERNRIEAMRVFEEKYADCDYICGIDEVGRGPLAGPVVACAMVLPKDCRILYVNDSKKLSEKKREELDEIIRKEAVSYSYGMCSAEVIDEINILQATYQAMREAVGKLSVVPEILLNDAVTIPGLSLKQVPIIHGDAKSISIASASIVAKVYRDRMMDEYDAVYPGYGFSKNKGYGTAAHMEALRLQGPCPIHRLTFVPEDIRRLWGV